MNSSSKLSWKLFPLILAVLSISTSVCSAAVPTLELIMSNSDWMGNAPENAYFSDDGSALYYQKKQQGNRLNNWFKYDLKTAQTLKLTPQQAHIRDSFEGVVSKNKKYKIFLRDDDVFVKDINNNQIKSITKTGTIEEDVSFVEDGTQTGNQPIASFWQNNDLYALNSQGELVVKALLKLSDKPNKESGYSFLNIKQQQYFETLREINRNKKLTKQRTQSLSTQPVKPFYLGANTVIIAKKVNPTGNYIVLVTQDTNDKEGRSGKLSRFVTDSGYINIEKVRTRVGQNEVVPQYLVLLDLK